jgi:hypothetical protein
MSDSKTKADDDFDPYSVKMCAQAGLKSADDEVQKVAEDTPSADAKANPKRMRAAFLKSKIWPAHTTIKIAFLKEAPENLKRTDVDFMEKTVDQEGNSLKLDPLQKQVSELAVKDAIIKTVTERLQPIVNVKLRFYDDNNELYNPNVADIRIDFNRFGGAWSLLGTECLTVKNKEEATMNFGWFDVPTTLHEFCHALGMVHEHQNPKGKSILWDKPRVREWANKTQGWSEETTNNNIIERYKLDEINGSTFDSKSIMLYFFPGDLVLDPETNKCCGEGTNQNLMFSPYDVLYLNYNYPLKKAKMTSEQFTVKFFNDVFNQQVDIEDLKKQLNSTRDDEKKLESTSSSSSSKPSAQFALQQPGNNDGDKKPDTTAKAPSASPAFALSQNDSSPSSSASCSSSMLEMCKSSCLNYSEIILASILFLIIVLLVIVIIVFVIHR